MTRPSPDPQGRDEDVLEQSEMLDEDELGVDTLEGGRDPAEGWSAADRHGTSATEQATMRPVSERLAEELPDTDSEPVRERPVAAISVDELDDTGESATRRGGHRIVEPNEPAADETTTPTEE